MVIKGTEKTGGQIRSMGGGCLCQVAENNKYFYHANDDATAIANAFQRSRPFEASLHSEASNDPNQPLQPWVGKIGGFEEFNDTQTGVLLGMPRSARCVQRFDDSLNSAIHITYRISLRSSSMREPRDPLLKVVHTHCFNKPYIQNRNMGCLGKKSIDQRCRREELSLQEQTPRHKSVQENDCEKMAIWPTIKCTGGDGE